ncbi:radical SAM/SPASM domain-containing protein [Pectinatus frisingensis]|uniref:radical SAM/SPASM domain-containing protein n=1 Tax=Pectinatus frisingensis TaxID=865 RepID=UPI0018C6A5A0|nr:radical SAM protein [Pectinatus frisingensis]
MPESKIKMLVLSLTGKCNFACRYCYAADHDKQIMLAETAIKAVRLAAQSGERFVIQFSGGEPLLNFDCLKAVVQYATDNKLLADLQLQTNASLLTDDIAVFLFKNKVAIGISMDGKPAMNDKLRLTSHGDGASNAILHGLEILKRNNIAVGLTCVVTSENVSRLPEVVDFSYYLGNIRKIGFDILRGQGRGTALQPPPANELHQVMQLVYERAEQLAKLTGYRIIFAQKERVDLLACHAACEFGHCYAMNKQAAFVDSAGDIYACSSLVGNSEFYIGNVDDGIDKSLLNKTSIAIKDYMLFCRSCKDFKLCGGGCFSRWYGTGDRGPHLSECALKRASIAAAQSSNNNCH